MSNSTESSSSSKFTRGVLGGVFLVAMVVLGVGGFYGLYSSYRYYVQTGRTGTSRSTGDVKKWSDETTSTETHSSGGYLTNGSFDDALVGWTEKHQSNTDDRWSVDVKSVKARDSVFDYRRTQSGADGGSVWLVQDLGLALEDYKRVRIELDVRILKQTLKRGSSYGEYPAMIVLRYRTKSGDRAKWRYGFLVEGESRADFAYQRVSRGEWFHFRSPNLKKIDPPPSELVRLKIGGRGWDFRGQFDHLLWVTKPNRK
ncbi:MAG: hypothetical protein ABEK50_06800 [bacterium]